MLKGIPSILSPELLKTLSEMGHGDEIIIADGNFPAVANAQRLIRADGHNVPELLDAILTLLPLDTYTETPVQLMSIVPGDSVTPVIWNEYESIVKKHFIPFKNFSFIERFDFYERSKKAFAIITTSEKALYANILLTKGVI